MFRLTACVLVLTIMSMVNGEKTEQEWLDAIDQLLDEVNKAYNNEDLSALRPTMTADVHYFPPGRAEAVGVDDFPFEFAGDFEMKQDDLRAFCGTGAVTEVKISLYDSNAGKNRNGKGLALVIEENGKVKLHSYIWNFDD